MHDVPEAAQICTNMADLFRYSIKGAFLTSLENEISIIDKYLYMIEIRFQGRISYKLEVADNTKECLIPKMILQPIVENAICHGADLCESERGKIKIEYIYGEEFLEFHVYNNGPKVVGEELERILNTPGKGYGIYNIRERIRMYYDEECGLYSSTTDEGMVCFSIKIRKEIENK